MSLSKKYIEAKTTGESLSNIRQMLKEEGILPDLDFMKCPHRRAELKKSYPDSFLGWKNNVPTFPVRNQYGGMSYTILKKSLNAAKSMYSRTNDPKYLDLIKQIEFELNGMENKQSKGVQTYHPKVPILDIISEREPID